MVRCGLLAANPRRLRSHAGCSEPVDGTEKSRHECRCGSRIDPFGSRKLLNASPVHNCQLIRKGHSLLLIVRYEQKGDTGSALHRLEFRAHLFTQFRIERRQRLIEQQQLRFQHQRARQRNALLFTARKLRRKPVVFGIKLYQIERLQCAFPPSAAPRSRSPNSTLPSAVRCGNNA